MILYSSGTTKGTRRPVERTAASLEADIQLVLDSIWIPPFILNIDICLPTDHIFGYIMEQVCIRKKVKYTLHDPFSPLTGNLNGNAIAATPRILKLYKRANLLKNHKLVISGSEKLTFDIPGAKVLEGYGMSEFGIIALSTLFKNRPGSVGKPILPLIIRKGIIRIYKDGRWHSTGDMGYLSDGYLYITGRAQDTTGRANLS